jgi:hypothetical protein
VASPVSFTCDPLGPRSGEAPVLLLGCLVFELLQLSRPVFERRWNCRCLNAKLSTFHTLSRVALTMMQLKDRVFDFTKKVVIVPDECQLAPSMSHFARSQPCWPPAGRWCFIDRAIAVSY